MTCNLELYQLIDEGNEINLVFSDISISAEDTTIYIDTDIEVEDVEIGTNIDGEKLDADFGIITERIIQGDTQIYKGDYIVTPKVSKQYLATKQKFMTDNVTVNEIPLYETDNQKGTTIYIGDKLI